MGAGRIASALAFAAAMLGAQDARADWTGFYTPTARAAQGGATGPAADPSGVCVQNILRAQLRYQIPGNLLLGLGIQEAGRMHEGKLTIWPWVANAEGEGRFFADRASAEAWVARRIAEGRTSVDLGCMQVSMRWHPEAFDTVADGFDPAQNVDYAARLLLRNYEKTGDWIKAAGAYFSNTPALQQGYLDRLEKNARIANDRIDNFRAIAAGTSARTGKDMNPDRKARAATPRRSEGPFWTAWLTRPDANRADANRADASPTEVRSLTGRGALRPVLPMFKTVTPGSDG